MKFTSFLFLSAVALVAAKEDGSDVSPQLRGHVAKPDSAEFHPAFNFGFLHGGSSSSADSNCNEISSKSKREDCKSRKKSNKSSSGSKTKRHGSSSSDSSGSSSRDSKCNEISSKSKREDCKKRKNTSSSSDFISENVARID
mmetsp:Transcript_5048/g.11017  ORF Transcript_5048/g.11017 Transcript_5048/m.11017 type:complete len:142 (-) Transcript_5048:174-599(-)|eukprot:CAMPEP_0183728718 /NCGR_PEP_ID=MMETSP0737-20130205/28738_1 /TAXON_ID=385413 /ORGANISM="Thalassiosira miniscula, Strain CCMP1093" /LENGTH=141 /DNA_ID=CAMNT_0025960731 /DNA_START=111 /DNA_END=536 /DNA_ORIENTATION=+